MLSRLVLPKADANPTEETVLEIQLNTLVTMTDLKQVSAEDDILCQVRSFIQY